MYIRQNFFSICESQTLSMPYAFHHDVFSLFNCQLGETNAVVTTMPRYRYNHCQGNKRNKSKKICFKI